MDDAGRALAAQADPDAEGIAAALRALLARIAAGEEVDAGVGVSKGQGRVDIVQGADVPIDKVCSWGSETRAVLLVVAVVGLLAHRDRGGWIVCGTFTHRV